MASYAHHAYRRGGPLHAWQQRRQRHDRRAGTALKRAGTSPPAPTRSRRAADLPDRVRGEKLPEQLARRLRRQAGRIRRDRRAAWPTRTRAWRPSRSTCFRDDPLGGARPSVHGGIVGFQTGLEYVNGPHKPLTASPFRSWSPSAAAASRCGASRGRRPGHQGDGARQPKGSSATARSERSHQRGRLLDFDSLAGGSPGAFAGEPGRRQMKARRSAPTDCDPRPPRPCSAVCGRGRNLGVFG